MTNQNLNKDKAIVVFSGGKIAQRVYFTLKHFKDVELVTFNYGQRHDAEIEVATRIAKAKFKTSYFRYVTIITINSKRLNTT